VSHPVSITAFYHFVDIAEADLPSLHQELMAYGQEHAMQGLVLIAAEGINGTVAGSAEVIGAWKKYLTGKFGEITFKDSQASGILFRKWAVKIKREIVGLGKPEVKPSGKHHHLSPEEWQKTLEQEDVVILDARNSYEYGIGKFAGAIDCGTRTFSEFPAFAEKAELPKDKKILMYCTGGIRCEKALIELESQGYQDVYQLDGGILAYLEKFPEGKFEGECFVFDYRVSVDGHLQPSKIYSTCPHCGNPGDMEIHCICGKNKNICKECHAQESRRVCSKRCKSESRKSVNV
jgi:UPF0176 protein